MALRALYELPAPAKLNAFLHIVGRRADGYHLLQSPFVLIDWCDLLHIERRDDGAMQRHDLGQLLPADDLCLRAARLLQGASGCTLGADISIDKRLPSGAGMGGGSSDAATVLLALNQLWGLHWPRQRLAELALKLGADVPFFVGGSNAFVEGIGERLTPIVWPEQHYVVVKPTASLATEAIFGDPALKRDTEPVILLGSFEDDIQAGRPLKVATEWVHGGGRNDLQTVASNQCPDVAQVSAWLDQHCGNSRMTGSGSAVFARVGSGDRLKATSLLATLPAAWVGRLCRSLQEHPLRGFAS
jgi:4-diphosphocytidyl-2-C-methyl-D-erythritol kinase